MNSILIGFHKKLGNIGKVDTIFIQWLLVLTGLRFRRRTSRRCGDLKHSCHGVRISRMQSRMQVVSLVVVAAAAAAASIKHDDDEALWFLGRLQCQSRGKKELLLLSWRITSIISQRWCEAILACDSRTKSVTNC